MTTIPSNFTGQLISYGVQAPKPLNGYDMLALGDWGGFISTYGVNIILGLIGCIIFLKLYFAAVKVYHRKLREEEQQRKIVAMLPGIYK